MNFPLTGASKNPDMVHHILFNDPPEHSRLRRAGIKMFAPRVVAQFDAWVRDIVREVLDRYVPKGEFDWVDEVARHVPALVIARIMGVPFDERAQIVKWADSLFTGAQAHNASELRVKVYEEIWAYTDALREKKLRSPEDDMITVLAHTMERGELNHREFLHFSHTLIVAGFETTHTLIGQSMREVIETPTVAACYDKACDSPALDQLVDEFLRYCCPVMNMARTATADIQAFGTNIRKGDMMQLFFTSANRDEREFDDADDFKPGRRFRDGVAFGSGPHRCLGASLAKLEMKILIEELKKREIRFNAAGQPKRGWSTWINQLTQLPVAVV